MFACLAARGSPSVSSVPRAPGTGPGLAQQDAESSAGSSGGSYIYTKLASPGGSPTALLRIASDFDGFSRQGWSFVLAQTVFLRIFPAKWVMVSAITIFEMVSLVCGLAQNVSQEELYPALVQRESVTCRKDRPKLYGLFGAVFIEPLIGGALTDYIVITFVSPYLIFFPAVPIGGVSLTDVLFLLKVPPPLGAELTKRSPNDIFRQVLRLDFGGATLIAAADTSLVLAPRGAGNTKPWAVIIPFSSLVRWCTLSPIAPSLLNSLPVHGHQTPHRSATQSGIELLPFRLGSVIAAIITGQMGSSTLLYSLNTSTSTTKIIGDQIFCGVGIGIAMQNSFLAMQVEFNNIAKLLGQASNMASFAQFSGDTLGLEARVGHGARGVPPQVRAGRAGYSLQGVATAIYTELPPEMIAGVVRAYMEALKIVFALSIPVPSP
ncbi:hypothetical protein C8J57DRAFT_1237369 [Mycena rebaudengoi]|nr:hypothetical protein C8J57DRAFT_1237369 [Mycena rebaudengoi]